ncbi:MAG: CapA family protein, partial [Patescibacteria group bacterium]
MKKIRVKKIKLIFVIALLVSVVGIYSLIKPKTTDVDFLFQNPTTTATVILVGDIMLDRGVEAEMENNGDWKWPFLEITDELKKADIVFGNLEGPISDMGTKVGSIYSFRADPKTIEGLTFAGFDILSVANNHALDYGRDALEDTFLRLRQANIDYVGGGNTLAEADSPISKEVDGTKIAFLAYTNLCSESWNATEKNSGINCIAEDDLETVKQKIRDTKNNADVLIVSLHSGGEYTQTLTALQTDFARSAIDAGADMVVEGHSHVVQKNEAYKDKYIFYSLGNFVFDQNFSEETMQGQMLKILIENKKIKEIIPIKIDINTDFQPEIAPAKKPFKLTQPSLPQIYLSASKLAQGDTLVIRVDNGTNTGKISATFGTTKIDFFKSG